MSDEEVRISIAISCGWKGCTDSNCEYRKCQHLHKGSVVGFPEPYSTSRYPDYANDLNAMQSAVLSQGRDFVLSFNSELVHAAQHRDVCIVELTAKSWAIIFLQVKRGSGHV